MIYLVNCKTIQLDQLLAEWHIIMAKNLSIFVFLVLIIAAGIGYSYYSDPELPAQQLVRKTLKEFANKSESIEREFESRGKMSSSSKNLTVKFVDANKSEQNLSVKMRVVANSVTLSFPARAPVLADQTIILEPFEQNGQIRWKCLGGSVLVRYRNKDCRIGKGISRQDIL